MSGGWTEPSWLGRATRCRGPTSTASRCPPIPTSSPTCWGACRLQPCQDCPSVGTAPLHQPVSQLCLYPFIAGSRSCKWSVSVPCCRYCVRWILSERWWVEDLISLVTVLTVCVGLLVKGYFHLILFRPFLI